MGLTRTKFSQANTAVARIQDPITVLNNEATVANVDVGFLINRNHGIKSNVALYWSETGSEFTTAFTSNTGIIDSNIILTSYANLRVGSIFANIGGAGDIANVYITGSLLPSANISYDLGSSDNRFKTLWLSGNTIVMGKESLTVNEAGEWVFTSGGNTATIGSLYNFVGDNATTGNLTVTGNLNVTGSSYIINSTNTSLVDSIIDLHTQSNLAPLTSDDGRDIGFKFHYYKTEDEHAFLGWANNSGYLEWYDSGREGVGNVFTGNTYGTIKTGGLLLVNNTPSISTTTGALKVTGGVGIQGNLYITNVGDVSANIGTFTASINSLNANIGAYQLYANANAASQQTTIDSFSSNAASQQVQIDNLDANVGGYQIFANANAGVQSVAISNIVSTANANTAAYLLTNTGNIAAGNLVASGNIYGGIVPTTIFKEFFIGTTAVLLSRGSGALTVDNFNTTGYAAQANSTVLATNATKTTVTSNVSSGTAYITFVNSTAGNVDQNINTALTYDPNSGNLRAYGILTDTAVYWAANGAVYGNRDDTLRANVAAYQTYANANVVAIQANLGAYQTYANANVVAIQANLGAYQIYANANVVAIQANIGSFQTYANTKIGTNNNSNVVVVSTTVSTSASTGALVVGGGIGVSGNIFTAGWIVPTANTTQNLGSVTNWWGTIYGVSQQARYADLAEVYVSDKDYEKGTVVSFGGNAEITITTISHDTKVAGIVSTNPGYLMNAGTKGLPIAFTGRVPCKVKGPVVKGEVLVSSDIPGVAQCLEQGKFMPGCVLGKSLEDIIDNNIHTIEVVVGRF